MSIRTDAWVIYAAREGEEGKPTELVRETVELEDPGPHELLVEPLYGCWEGNMGHALARDPIDICALRGLEKAVIGNAGTGRVIEVGSDVPAEYGYEPGQAVMFIGMEADEFGYPVRMMGYDSRKQGIQCKRVKRLPEDVVPIPAGSRFDLATWAAFNVRYATAWECWRMALGTFRLQLGEDELPVLNVWGWGGGSSLALTHLAAMLGHRAAAISSKPERLALIRDLGITGIDRSPFADLQFDERRFAKDADYAASYRAAEKRFLETVHEVTEGSGVHVFVDMIGAPVHRATLKALARMGVLVTAGWKAGMQLSHLRAIECIQRHQFVHTHFARRSEVLVAMQFAEENGWMPVLDETVFDFDELPELAARFAAGDYRMFPVYRINEE